MAPWVKLKRGKEKLLVHSLPKLRLILPRIKNFRCMPGHFKKEVAPHENEGTKAKLIMRHSTHIRPDRHHVEKNRGWGNVSILEQTCKIYICSMFIDDMNGTIGICGH